MASLRKKPRSKYWWACVTLPNGKRTQFSTGLVDKAAALEIAQRSERETRRQTSETKLRTALARLVADVIGTSMIDPAEWVEAWAKGKAGTVRDASAGLYAMIAKALAEFLRSEKTESLAAVKRSDLERLRDKWASEHAATTVNTRLKTVRRIFRDALAEKLIDDNPAEGLSNLRESGTTERREFRPAELQTLLAAADQTWKTMILLGLYTGQRIGDLCELRWRNIDLAQRTLTAVAEKTGATIALPLVEPLADALLELTAGDDPDAFLFPDLAAKSRGARSAAFRCLLASVGLATKVEKYNGSRRGGVMPGRRRVSPLSFHSLRHTATTMLKAAGVADSVARAIIGHESPAVSRLYTHLDMETMRKAMERMPSVLDVGKTVG